MCLLLLLAGCTSPGEIDRWTPHGEPLESVKVQDFTLTSSEGTDWTYSEEAANTTLVIAFLFTNCLDICPIVTHNMKWVKSQLTADELNKTTFLTITVDPWRDNVSTLHDWKTSTNSEWIHLTSSSNDSESPSMKALQDVWINFGVGLTIEEYDANNDDNTSNSSDAITQTTTPSTTKQAPFLWTALVTSVCGGATTTGCSIWCWMTCAI